MDRTKAEFTGMSSSNEGEPSSISRFAREEATCDETVAIAVLRKKNGIVSSSLGARRSLFARVLDDAMDSRHPV